MLEGHRDPVTACAFSPDGSRIVSASQDETLRIWNARTGRCEATLEVRGDPYTVWVAGKSSGAVTVNDEIRRLADFSVDGRHIVATVDGRTLTVWDAATQREVARVTSLYSLFCIAADRGASHLAWGDGRGVVSVIDLHGLEGSACAFRPTGAAAVAERPLAVPAKEGGGGVTCPRCGFVNPSGARWCLQDGSDLPGGD